MTKANNSKTKNEYLFAGKFKTWLENWNLDSGIWDLELFKAFSVITFIFDQVPEGSES
jgi:hypothetical protein